MPLFSNQRFFVRLALVSLVAVLAGCGTEDRDAAIDTLNPAPMSAAMWSRVPGTYAGPIRETTERYGFEDLAAMDTRLDLSGWADSPAVVFRMIRGYSTAWTMYGEWKGTFTNIPAKRYGTQGTVTATTHAPNQMLLILRRNGASPLKGTWMILTFQPDGSIDVQWLGHAGWHGEGELWRVPAWSAHS